MIKLSDSMKNRILNKLRSRTGASISYALLLFLVCAVLCSVILAAATAAAGRMSKIAETDQRYYAVTSAAEALTDLIDGKTVSIVEVTTTTIKTTYKDGVAGTPIEGIPETKTYIVANKKASQISEADYKDFVDDTIPVDAAKNASEMTAVNKKLKLTSAFSSAAGLDYDALAVTVNEAIDADGNVTLTLFNTYKAKAENSDDNSRYKMILSFGADRSETNSSVTKTKNETLNVVSETSYTVESEKTDTKITTLTWNLASIKTNTGT